MTEDEKPSQREIDESAGSERLMLALLIPSIGFLFALLVIYGLSRIFLEFDSYEIGDVSMATPLAIGVSLFILLAATVVASSRNISRTQIGLIASVAVVLLIVGGIWSAVRDDNVTAEHVVETAEPTVAPGTIGVDLVEFSVTTTESSIAAGEVTFSVSNEGASVHNFRVISTDLAADALPVDDDTFTVNESAVDVVASSPDIFAEEAEEVVVDLEAGSYVLICNIPPHYQSGMFVAFTVE